jgi:hypothetical protein
MTMTSETTGRRGRPSVSATTGNSDNSLPIEEGTQMQQEPRKNGYLFLIYSPSLHPEAQRTPLFDGSPQFQAPLTFAIPYGNTTEGDPRLIATHLQTETLLIKRSPEPISASLFERALTSTNCGPTIRELLKLRCLEVINPEKNGSGLSPDFSEEDALKVIGHIADEKWLTESLGQEQRLNVQRALAARRTQLQEKSPATASTASYPVFGL